MVNGYIENVMIFNLNTKIIKIILAGVGQSWVRPCRVPGSLPTVLVFLPTQNLSIIE